MWINTKIRYGLRTIIEIAESSEGGILQKDIAHNQNLSLKYLDAIIAALKLKGLIIKQKGKGNGYVLARPSEEITMLDIYTAFEPLHIVDCTENRNYCDRIVHCRAKDYWDEFKGEVQSILRKKNLSQILKESKNEDLSTS
ncbi:MAG: Rrf2 family transcriptional regulator [Bacteroidota bacterium]|nr:Rrf2 family transcriptional regulator [Bacteroidota bacterium]